jgi:hypothetical protein
MSKFALMVLAAAISVAGASAAQSAAKGKGKDLATCSRLIKNNPAYLTRGECARACAAAIRSCMRGEPY